MYAFIEDAAASGGYWLACAADEIYCCENSIVGSIGVISSSFGFSKLLKHYGIERRVFTAGKCKSILDPFKDLKESDVKSIQASLNIVHENFKNFVRERRGKRLKADEETLFSGEFWIGRKAAKNGLVDGVMDLNKFLGSLGGNVVAQRMVPKPPGLTSLLNMNLPSFPLSEIVSEFLESIKEDQNYNLE